MGQTPQADVCIVLEGTYPYVSGGVSNWANALLHAQRDLTFHLVCLMAGNTDLTPRYKIPSNVTGITHVEVGSLPEGAARLRGARQLFERLEVPLRNLQFNGGLRDLADVLAILGPLRAQLGRSVLLDSPEAWELLLRMYHASHNESPFLDFFWTWRTIVGGLYSILLAPLPSARVYHPLCTGYAGLFAARARLETGRPVLLTEHGIYTNERRIEIAMAEWLYRAPSSSLDMEKAARDLKDMWVDTFTSYSRACYEAASKVVTLFGGNRQLQIEDGADPGKIVVIPNAVDYERLSQAGAKRTKHPPTVALIGRVVPLKDIKTYNRAIAILRTIVPGVRALVLGPTDEDLHYFAECQSLVNHLGLQECFTFAGRVSVAEHLGGLDVMVLTSISEAQPLVILEAGSAGVPSVATDVGACREMIYGDLRETEPLGPAGEVVPLSNPTATAQAIARLLTDRAYWERASRAIRERVRRYYNKPALDGAYREIYGHWIAADTEPLHRGGAA
ncbi:MAG: GT4 family glycosyltransferase PelF [Candidatus Solibacter sp.]|nr:GT4 family glycosyltransferase PelF [Candidatus Solibacter sp.]